MYKVLLSNNRLSIPNHLMLGHRATPAGSGVRAHRTQSRSRTCSPSQTGGMPPVAAVCSKLGLVLVWESRWYVVTAWPQKASHLSKLHRMGGTKGCFSQAESSRWLPRACLPRCRRCSCLPLLVTQCFVVNSAFPLDFGALLQFKQLPFLASCSNCSSMLNTSKRF